jgi:HTH-type transcriptional regulator / antitoxin HigA
MSKFDVSQLAECFPVGEFLREEIQWRGWTLEAFAKACDVPLERMHKIVEEGDLCTMAEADKIAEVLVVSPALLLSLQRSYLKWKASRTKQ